MKNEAEIHRCRECKLLEPLELGIVKFGVCLLEDYEVKNGHFPKERFNELLSKMVSKMPDIGTIRCGQEKQTVCALRICDKENIFSPRRDMRYWFSILRNATSFVSRLIPKHD